MERGRIDVSGSACAAPVSLDDVRIVTRFQPDSLYPCLRTSCHEAGHAMYEQGKNRIYTGLPVGQALSIGMHESQSCFWERMITRNLPFWNWSTEKVGKKFPHAEKVTPDDWYFAEMFKENFNFDELPGLWDEQMKELLDIEVPDDKNGCLQDVHWSINNIGYFPGYLIGAMTAAQLYAHVKRVIPDIEEQIARGYFKDIGGWLNENIHSASTCYPSLDELLTRATGEELNAEHFLKYLQDKYTTLYKNK